MSNEIEFTVLDDAPAIEPGPGDLARVHDVPVEIAVEIGRTRMTIAETLSLGPGAIVSLNRLAGEPVDLLINGKPIARGEVVVIDEEFGLRVTDVVSTGRSIEDEVETAEAVAAQAEADLIASMATSEEPPPLPDPFAEASVDDLPIGGLPEPGVVDPDLA